jgi:hypothetical protein
MPLPRQAYGIDFYGHEKGEILVAVDSCTRTVDQLGVLQRRVGEPVVALTTMTTFGDMASI